MFTSRLLLACPIDHASHMTNPELMWVETKKGHNYQECGSSVVIMINCLPYPSTNNRDVLLSSDYLKKNALLSILDHYMIYVQEQFMKHLDIKNRRKKKDKFSTLILLVFAASYYWSNYPKSRKLPLTYFCPYSVELPGARFHNRCYRT